MVFIRDLKREQPHRIALGVDGALPELSPRDRFTLAHEIVHTFFFNSASPPGKIEGYPRGRTLEDLCQYGARQLLLPEPLLKRQLTGGEPVSSGLVCRIADYFGASPEVVIRRLDECGTIEHSGPSLLIAREMADADDAEIIAAFIDPLLLTLRLRPEPYSSLSDWSAGMLDESFWASARWQGTSTIKDSTVRFRKIPYNPGTHFIEIEVTAG